MVNLHIWQKVYGYVNKCLKLQECLNWTPLPACNTKLAICAVGFVFIAPLGGNTTHDIMSKQELISRHQCTNKGCLEFFLHSGDEVMKQNAKGYLALRYFKKRQNGRRFLFTKVAETHSIWKDVRWNRNLNMISSFCVTLKLKTNLISFHN